MDQGMIYILFICIMVPLLMMLPLLEGRSRLFLGYMMIGIFACLFAAGVNGYVRNNVGNDLYYITTNLTPVTEEIIKALPILYYAFVFDAEKSKLIPLAFAVGVGFAVLENIVILIRSIMTNPDSVSYLWAFVRGFGSGLMHAVTTMLIGIGISYIGYRKKLLLPGIFALIAMGATYHSIYNSMVQTDLKYFGFVLPLLTYIALTPLTFKKVDSKKKEVAA